MSSISKVATIAVAFLAAAPSALAGKRGLAWPWCTFLAFLGPLDLLIFCPVRQRGDQPEPHCPGKR
jgi:hypothetical protein